MYQFKQPNWRASFCLIVLQERFCLGLSPYGSNVSYWMLTVNFAYYVPDFCATDLQVGDVKLAWDFD